MHSDPIKVRQCVTHLLNNANKFTERGQIRFTVTRKSGNGGDRIVFRVDDTGIGMTQEQIKKLYQPFSQAENSASRRYGGSGLGLAITKTFSEMMGGSITVDSVLGEGSTFVLDLPAQSSPTGPSRHEGAFAQPAQERG